MKVGMEVIMENSGGELRVYNPDRQISEQITLKTIVLHDAAMRLSRTGVPELPSEKPLNFNQRIQLRFKGLNEIISSQQGLVTIARPIVKFSSEQGWNKKYKTDEEKKENLFEEMDNEYNELRAILRFLNDCEKEIITARKTKKFDDDFVWEKQDNMGEIVLELSPNFFKMLKELEDSYEAIYDIMLKNKIVSSGISIDEELSYEELIAEASKRVIES